MLLVCITCMKAGPLFGYAMRLVCPACMQEAGATPAIELAFTIADGLEYIRCAQVRLTANPLGLGPAVSRQSVCRMPSCIGSAAIWHRRADHHAAAFAVLPFVC